MCIHSPSSPLLTSCTAWRPPLSLYNRTNAACVPHHHLCSRGRPATRVERHAHIFKIRELPGARGLLPDIQWRVWQTVDCVPRSPGTDRGRDKGDGLCAMEWGVDTHAKGRTVGGELQLFVLGKEATIAIKLREFPLCFRLRTFS